MYNDIDFVLFQRPSSSFSPTSYNLTGKLTEHHKYWHQSREVWKDQSLERRKYINKRKHNIRK